MAGHEELYLPITPGAGGMSVSYSQPLRYGYFGPDNFSGVVWTVSSVS